MKVSPAKLALTVGASSAVTISNNAGTVAATSSAPSIATVTLSGATATVKALAAGSATIKFVDSKTTINVAVSVSGTTTTSASYTLLAWNDLGMHCMDGLDYSIFSILPPYNTLHPQLKDKSGKLIANNVLLTYESVADSTGSINTISSTKTNFWTWVTRLVGLSPDTDIGLNLDGLASSAPLPSSPAHSRTPAPLSYNSEFGWFEAEGIPVTSFDDAGKKNFYPTIIIMKLKKI